ncbi:hypothetical protein NU10_12805 [Flavobacterium dauae]|uniref:hypothetical protein n=1 Tax=Flavobacterium dauae TaxID=1563479 RepID=UPI00101B4626|nr:hypothetical protein [Flavobacterium dauae]WLD23570.1 hypothetical protein NU10_12805 [Flavobacterium dauae]
MSIKTILKIALVPIWLLFFLFAIQYIFGLISEPNSLHVFYGVVLLCLLIGVTLFLIFKMYLKDE